MKGRAPKIQSNGDFNSVTVDDVFAAFDSSSTAEIQGSNVDNVVMNNLKLVTKKNSQTRIKALSDLLSDLKIRLSEGEVRRMVSLFVDSFSRGALLDPSWKCRSLYSSCLLEIFKAVGGRFLEPHLPRIIPILVVSQFDDTSREVHTAAKEVFECMFPAAEKRNKVLEHFESQISKFLVDNLESNPLILSKLFRSTEGGESTPDEEFESLERYERVVRSTIKCIAKLFPNFSPDKIISLISPSTTPSIQLEAIRYLQSNHLNRPLDLPESLTSYLITNIATSGSAPNFLQDSVWSLFKSIPPTHAFSKKDNIARLLNFIVFLDPRSWSQPMMDILPSLVQDNRELVEKVNQKISESVLFRSPKLFQSLSRFALNLVPPNSVDSQFRFLVSLAQEKEYKQALVSCLNPEDLFLIDEKISDPIILILLFCLKQFSVSSSNLVEKSIHSIVTISDLEFIISNSMGNKTVLKSLSTHPLIVSPEWICADEYTDLVDCALSQGGWLYLSDLYTTTIAPSLPFPSLVRLITKSNADWIAYAVAPRIVKPESFIESLLNSENEILLQQALMYRKPSQRADSQIVGICDNGIICIGREDFDQVVSSLLVQGSLVDVLMESNVITESLAISSWKRICSDHQIELVEDHFKILRFCSSRDEQVVEIVTPWFFAAFVHADSRFKHVDIDDIMGSEEIGKSVLAQLMINHRFEMKQSPLNMEEFFGFDDIVKIVAVWMIRRICEIDNRKDWEEFMIKMKIFSDAKSLVMELMALLDTDQVKELGSLVHPSHILDCVSLVLDKSTIPSESRNELSLQLKKLKISEAVSASAALVLWNGEGTDMVSGVGWSDGEFAKLLNDATKRPLSIEECKKIMDLGKETDFLKYAERAMTYHSLSENVSVTGSLYHIDDFHVARWFIQTNDVEACESVLVRYWKKTGKFWGIPEEFEKFIACNCSYEWAVKMLSTPFCDLSLDRLLVNDLDLNRLLSIREFRSVLRDVRDEQVAIQLMDHIVKKFLSSLSSGDFTTLFELSETIGGDETDELREIFNNMLMTIGEELVDNELGADEKVFNWFQCLSPGEVHDWVSKGPHNFSEALVRSGVASRLIDQSLANRYVNASLKQSYSKSSRLLTCRYTTCGGEITAELSVTFPEAWPARLATIEVSQVAGLSRAKNARLKISTQQVFRNNGVQHAVQIWIENIEGNLANVEECYICYSVTYHHGTKGTGSGTGSGGAIPDKECRNCHYKFHAQCLLKWFKQSQKTNCVLCQQPF